MNHYASDDQRKTAAENSKPKALPSDGHNSPNQTENETEKRLPGRFSRIDRSDSDSEEDDRLDDFIDSDDQEAGNYYDEGEEADYSLSHSTPVPSADQSTDDISDADPSTGVESEEHDNLKETDCNGVNDDDMLSDLEVPETDAIRFDEDEDFESKLDEILDEKNDKPALSVPLIDERKVQESKSVPPVDKDTTCTESSSPKRQQIAANSSVESTKKTIRLKRTDSEDPLERRKRKFGPSDDVKEEVKPEDKPIRMNGKSNFVSGPDSTVRSKRIRSFVVMKK